MSGYFGRMGIFEIFALNRSIRSLILANATEDMITQEARKFGLEDLRQRGIAAVLAGQTTVEEVLRVTEERE